MSLSVGTRLGSYEITGQLGAGGMGEVYRATDTRLGREVAIKVLPDSFSADADRVTRFEQEARTLASLNHPNIAQIHGLETTNGSTAIVMELVEGPTLADRLADGPIAVRESIDIAIQIANAVEAAHMRGIVHRDLKPANIKLRSDGTVKVLDFGIAKTLQPAVTSGGPEPAALTMPALTETGMILGTAGYMSPEQARGKSLDEKTDIWAFGAILYEMLTGQPPFLGEDVAVTVAAILKTEPDWDAIPELPSPLLMFIKQCLAKDPGDRLHNIADVRLALAGKFDVSRLAPAAATDGSAGGRTIVPGWLAAVTAALVLGASGTFYLNGASRPLSTDVSYRQLTFRNGEVGMARFAPDGQVIVYSASWDGKPYRIFTTRTDSYQSSPLVNVPPADLLAISSSSQLAISLDRQSVGGFQPRGVLAEAGLAGGAPRLREDDVVYVDWGPDGEIAAIVRLVEDGMQIEFPVGSVVYKTADGDVIGSMRVSPDGESVCFGRGYLALFVSGKGGPARQIGGRISRISNCAWSPAGDEIWFSCACGGGTYSNLEAITPDGQRRRVLERMPSNVRIYDVSPTGQVLVSVGSLHYTVRGSPGPDTPEADLGVFDATRLAHLNAAGTDLLLMSSSTSSRDLFLRSFYESDPIPIGEYTGLALTPDREFVAVLGDGSGRVSRSSQITLVPTGVGMPRTIDLDVEIVYAAGNPRGTNNWEIRNPEFSANGERLLLPYGIDENGVARAYVHDLANSSTRAVTPDGITGPVVLSPDGRSVAFQDGESLYIQSVDDPEQDPYRAPGGPEAGKLARWSDDGKWFYLVEQDGPVAAIHARSVETGDRRQVREIRVPDPAGVTRFELWVSADGQAYAYTLDRLVSNLFLLENLD